MTDETTPTADSVSKTASGGMSVIIDDTGINNPSQPAGIRLVHSVDVPGGPTPADETAIIDLMTAADADPTGAVVAATIVAAREKSAPVPTSSGTLNLGKLAEALLAEEEQRDAEEAALSDSVAVAKELPEPVNDTGGNYQRPAPVNPGDPNAPVMYCLMVATSKPGAIEAESYRGSSAALDGYIVTQFSLFTNILNLAKAAADLTIQRSEQFILEIDKDEIVVVIVTWGGMERMVLLDSGWVNNPFDEAQKPLWRRVHREVFAHADRLSESVNAFRIAEISRLTAERSAERAVQVAGGGMNAIQQLLSGLMQMIFGMISNRPGAAAPVPPQG